MKRFNAAPLEGGNRLHPAALLFFIGKWLKDLLYPLLAFFLSAVFRQELQPLWLAGGALLFVLLICTLGWLTWLRFTYFLEADGIRVVQGILVRNRIWIHRSRVQSIDTSESLLHRLLGVSSLQIDTAGGKKPEVQLRALSLPAVEQIKNLLQAGAAAAAAPIKPLAAEASGNARTAIAAQEDKRAAPIEAQQVVRYKRTLSVSELLLYSMTAGGSGVVLAFLSAAYFQLDDWLEARFNLWGIVAAAAGALHWAGIIVALLLVAWLLAFIGGFVRAFGFTLELGSDRLLISQGLLERKQVMIQLARIQAVTIEETPLRSLFNRVSIRVLTAGGSGGGNGQSALLFPLLRKEEVTSLLQRVAPELAPQNTLALPKNALPLAGQQQQRLPRRALLGYLLLPLSFSLLAAAVLWFINPLPAPSGLLLVALPAIVALLRWLSWRNTGWRLADKQLAIRFGSIKRTTVLTVQRRVQWSAVSQHALQRRKSLATFHFAVAGASSFAVRHLPEADAQALEGALRG